MHYLLQAVEPVVGWPGVQAARKNNSETWANFIYEDLICRFGCIPYCIVDGGSEFKGAVKILFKKYGVTVIISSPYYPQENIVIECAHQVIVNALFCICDSGSNKWPLFICTVLLAICCTVSHMTGYTPYYLLYECNPLLVFDIMDCTWEMLDRDKVITMEDIITIQTLQISQWDTVLMDALKQQSANTNILLMTSIKDVRSILLRMTLM